MDILGDILKIIDDLPFNLGLPSLTPYVTEANSNTWMKGIPTHAAPKQNFGAFAKVKTKRGSEVPAESEAIKYAPLLGGLGFRPLNDEEKKDIGNPSGLMINDSVQGMKVTPAISDPDMEKRFLNENIEDIQNAEGFPKQIKHAEGLTVAEYDYRIQVGDTRYELMTKMEDQLMKIRASVGLPVHGQRDIAKAMKYYMYNRFKTPDINMAHNKSITHVFFTRPDLNLLNYRGGANRQTLDHSESSMLWRRNPELFKLLTDHKRCGDSNNFNLLLSNQVTSFEIKDEQLSYVEAGKSWAEYTMNYGEAYTGRNADEFSCTFIDTNDYSVINLIKLWITYIDNVAKGAWMPSYDLRGRNANDSNFKTNDSHVFSKTLDYAASCYVFKCGPDGEDILYWSKYFGVFPINTGAQALSWELGGSTGEVPKLNIRFRYSFKRDLNPVSLLEFNSAADIKNLFSLSYEDSFNPNYGHSSRPYVGAPFIEMRFNEPFSGLGNYNGVGLGENAPNSSIRLKFRPVSDYRLTDEKMYKARLSNSSGGGRISSLIAAGISAGFDKAKEWYDEYNDQQYYRT